MATIKNADVVSLRSDLDDVRRDLDEIDARIDDLDTEQEPLLASVDDVARAIATADEQSFAMLEWADRDRYRRFAEAAIIAAGGEPT